jgi:transcriptional regulator GlxA family with amidase domain
VEAATSVARRLVVPPHREGQQAQFVERPMLRDREGARVVPFDRLDTGHLSEQHTIYSLAKNAGMSIRMFQRRFEAVTQAPSAAAAAPAHFLRPRSRIWPSWIRGGLLRQERDQRLSACLDSC